MGRPVLEVSRATIATLQAHSWPGNVRELENVIERAVILSRGKWAEISVDVPQFGDQMRTTPSESSPAGNGSRSTLDDLQRQHIRTTLEELNWRVEGRGGAAEVLGMNPNTLRSRMRKLGLRRPGNRPAEPLAS
jgi:formate hydrogenlyase transcriptional activator